MLFSILIYSAFAPSDVLRILGWHQFWLFLIIFDVVCPIIWQKHRWAPFPLDSLSILTGIASAALKVYSEYHSVNGRGSYGYLMWGLVLALFTAATFLTIAKVTTLARTFSKNWLAKLGWRT